MIATLAEFAGAHALALIVFAPLAGAALTALIASARGAWVFACVLATLIALLALALAAPEAPASAMFQFDAVNTYSAPLVALCAALCVMAAGALLHEWTARAAPLALALMLVVGAGWLGALLARDLLGVYLGAEAAWLASIGLVALHGERDRGALNGAMRMLGAGAAASVLGLIGIAFIARSIGGLSLAALPGAQIDAPGAASIGVGLVVISLAVKAGAAPLHAWAGAAYGRGGACAALMLGVVGAVGALATLVRVAAYASPAPDVGEGLASGLAALGGASVLIGSAQAIGARDVRRLAAYAVAAQGGGVILCAALGSPASFAAAAVQLVALAASTLALLGGAALGGARAMEALDGMAGRAPIASACITASALCLMGAPLTVGFLGRWRLIEAGVGADLWWTAAAAIVTSLAGVFYGGRLVQRLYFRHASTTAVAGEGAWRFLLAPALAASVIAIGIGVAPESLLALAARASGLVGGAP